MKIDFYDLMSFLDENYNVRLDSDLILEDYKKTMIIKKVKEIYDDDFVISLDQHENNFMDVIHMYGVNEIHVEINYEIKDTVYHDINLINPPETETEIMHYTLFVSFYIGEEYTEYTYDG